MSKKTKTSTVQDQNTHMVSTPTNPDWSTNLISGLAGDQAKLSQLDPYSLVSGPNGLQQQATQGAMGLGLKEAPQVQAASLLDNLQGYMNPYTNNVVDTTLAGFDKNSGMVRAQQALDLARNQAWGGSRAAIAQGMTEQNLAQQRAATEAGLRSDAFNVGAGLSNMDAGRRQDASSQNAQLLLANDANNRANVATQGALGSDMRNITQQQLNAPISLLSARTGLAQSLPLSMFTGQNQDGTMHGTSTSTTTQSDPMGTLGSLAMLAAAPFTGGATLLGSGMAGLGLGAGASALAANAAAFKGLAGVGS